MDIKTIRLEVIKDAHFRIQAGTFNGGLIRNRYVDDVEFLLKLVLEGV